MVVYKRMDKRHLIDRRDACPTDLRDACPTDLRDACPTDRRGVFE